jgi:hypothetical protein
MAVVSAMCVCGMASTAAAQQRRVTPRPATARLLVIGIDGLYQTASSSTLVDSGSFTTNLERATYRSSFALRSGPTYDVSASVRLIRHLSVAVGGSSRSRSTAADVSGSIPHPFFLDQPRDISGSQSLGHEETAIRIDAVWTVPMTPRLSLAVSAGPTMFRVKQDVVTGVAYDEAYPYDVATFTLATTLRRSESAVGVNGGVEVTFRLTPNLGVAGVLRASHGSASVDGAGSTPIELQLGGVQAGAGVRLWF